MEAETCRLTFRVGRDVHTRRGCRSIRLHFGEHLHALRNQLARRLLPHVYPEGWGMRPGQVATGPTSADADCDNGTVAVYGTPRYRWRVGGYTLATLNIMARQNIDEVEN
jgi:hypothetical protein